MADDQESSGRVAIRTKLWWGLGSAAERIALGAIGTFAFFYYNQVVGVSATLAGLAVTLSLILDGITDPLMGSVSDRTRSRFGRRHPYMFAAPVPMALSLYAIFNPPAALEPLWLFVWFAVFVSSLRVSMTLFNVPHLALGSELSSDYRERSAVMSYNTFFGFTAGALLNWIAYTLFFHATPEYPRGLMNPDAYSSFGLAAAAAVFVALFASAWFTRDRIPTLPKAPPDLPRYSLMEFWSDVRNAFANPNYVFLLIAIFFVSCQIGISAGLMLYVQTFFWGLTSEEIRWFVAGDIVGFAITFLTVASANARFGKRNTIVVAGLVMMLFPVLAPGLKIVGIFPGADSALYLPLLVGANTVTFSAMTMVGISVMSALADIADENELRFGVRQEGVLYSTRALFAKIDSAIGALLAGVALDVLQFPVQASPEAVSTAMSTKLVLIATAGAAIPGLIGVFFYSRYRIDLTSYQDTRKRLDESKAARAAGT